MQGVDDALKDLENDVPQLQPGIELARHVLSGKTKAAFVRTDSQDLASPSKKKRAKTEADAIEDDVLDTKVEFVWDKKKKNPKACGGWQELGDHGSCAIGLNPLFKTWSESEDTQEVARANALFGATLVHEFHHAKLRQLHDGTPKTGNSSSSAGSKRTVHDESGCGLEQKLFGGDLEGITDRDSSLVQLTVGDKPVKHGYVRRILAAKCQASAKQLKPKPSEFVKNKKHKKNNAGNTKKEMQDNATVLRKLVGPDPLDPRKVY